MRKITQLLLTALMIFFSFSGNAYASVQIVTATVHSGQLFDLVTMVETNDFASADFWWGQVNDMRYLVPKNYATFAIMGNADLETVDCKSASYSSAKIDGSINNNQIPTGIVICIKTGYTRYLEEIAIRIDSYGSDLAISKAIPETVVSGYPAERPHVFIHINSVPAGAQIWMDGENTGKMTPDEIAFTEKGDHIYELLLDGYQPYQESFYISESISRDILLTLQTSTLTTTPAEQLQTEQLQTPIITPEEQIQTPTPIPTERLQTPTPVPIKRLQTPKSTSTKRLQTPTPAPTKRLQTQKSIPTQDYPTSTPSSPGFLSLPLIIAIFFAYFFSFKKRN